jgi:hypothetical protein
VETSKQAVALESATTADKNNIKQEQAFHLYERTDTHIVNGQPVHSREKYKEGKLAEGFFRFNGDIVQFRVKDNAVHIIPPYPAKPSIKNYIFPVIMEKAAERKKNGIKFNIRPPINEQHVQLLQRTDMYDAAGIQVAVVQNYEGGMLVGGHFGSEPDRIGFRVKDGKGTLEMPFIGKFSSDAFASNMRLRVVPLIEQEIEEFKNEGISFMVDNWIRTVKAALERTQKPPAIRTGLRI